MSDHNIFEKLPIRKQILAVGALVLLLPFLAIGASDRITLDIGTESYQVELATTSDQRRLGLMHRDQLNSREGLLLVYRDAGDHRIWMKNVLIPLRVYWIDSDYRVIDMQRLEPCVEDPCPVYRAVGNSRYVLELGDYEHPLVPGDRIDALRDL